jgi:hypothetical protein
MAKVARWRFLSFHARSFRHLPSRPTRNDHYRYRVALQICQICFFLLLGQSGDWQRSQPTATDPVVFFFWLFRHFHSPIYKKSPGPRATRLLCSALAIEVSVGRKLQIKSPTNEIRRGGGGGSRAFENKKPATRRVTPVAIMATCPFGSAPCRNAGCHRQRRFFMFMLDNTISNHIEMSNHIYTCAALQIEKDGMLCIVLFFLPGTAYTFT